MNGTKKRVFVALLLLASSALTFFQLLLNYDVKLELLVSKPTVRVFRIEMWFAGKCIGVSPRGRVETMFCNPRDRQYFQFLPDGRLLFGDLKNSNQEKSSYNNTSNHDNSGYRKCVREGTSGLELGDCSTALMFELSPNSSFLYSQPTTQNKKCLSPFKITSTGRIPKLYPINHDPVGLTGCDQDASRVTLHEENQFQEDRKYLKLPLPASNPKCDFPGCGINPPLPPASLVGTSERCFVLSSCITVLTKTARRPHLVLRMIDSLRGFQQYRDLPVVVIDDGVGPHSEEIMKRIAECPNLRYVIVEERDIGISQGRNLGLQLVKTKYFLLIDDDNLFLPSTNLEMLVNILDTTDASLVGGKYSDHKDFSSFLEFKYARVRLTGKTLPVLKANIPGSSCSRTNDTIPSFPGCMRCDVTSNNFLARTRDVIEVGGWSKELKAQEHLDLFIRLKAARKKVVYCPSHEVANVKPTGEDRVKGYRSLRHGREVQMRSLFANRWNVVHRYDYEEVL